jgi:hypothetical protein
MSLFVEGTGLCSGLAQHSANGGWRMEVEEATRNHRLGAALGVQMGGARVERIRRVEEAMQTMTWGDRGVEVE